MSGPSRTLVCSLVGLAAFAQSSEVATKEATITFKSTSNLVPVTVVVRDARGQVVSNLSRDDFQLFDNGKPQLISRFAFEKLGAAIAAAAPSVQRESDAAPASSSTPLPETVPNRFIAYLFDDLHITTPDLIAARTAALRQIEKLRPSERAAIYTTSGARMTDFTANRENLRAALNNLTIGRGTATKTFEEASCPPMTYFMADLIDVHHDPQAFDAAAIDTVYCMHLPAVDDRVKSFVTATARTIAAQGDRDTLTTLDALRLIVGKLAAMPGQRSLVLISPGFLVTDDRLTEQTRLIDRAIRANIVIGALDARGLFTQIPGGDASAQGSSILTVATNASLARAESMHQVEVMSTLAAGTGGSFYKGTNDLDDGLNRTASAPESLYILGFTPQNFKLDGSYHNLKVTLKNSRGTTLQVRKGYYAPKSAADPKETAKQQLEEALFSRDEIHDLPATLQTKFFKLDNGDATVSAVSTLDVKKLAFHKEADRNLNEVTVQTALFDDDGNFVAGLEKILTLRLLDETLNTRLGSGVAIRSSFTVHPGHYLVRMVVRDTEGQLMTAQSSAVEIP